MATIFYSMAGEGRGHAVRARTLVEHLRARHKVVLFASDEAYDFLHSCYGSGAANVELVSIPGIRFHYTQGRLNLIKSIVNAGRYLFFTLRPLVKRLAGRIEADQPDLVITDFEPALPRAARRCRRPYMCLNHQHFLVSYDLSTLPLGLRVYAWLMSLVVRIYHNCPASIVVSSFFTPPLKRGHENVRQVGPLLRSEIVDAQPHTGDFLLSYLRPLASAGMLASLKSCDREVHVYGLGERPDDDNLKFRAIDPHRFVDELANCAGLVSAAGNQLLGEAVFLGKPVLAVPEALHHEQLINAHFLEQMGAGKLVPLEKFDDEHLFEFLAGLEGYRAALEQYCGRLNGTGDAIAAIEEALAHDSQLKSPSNLAAAAAPPGV